MPRCGMTQRVKEVRRQDYRDWLLGAGHSGMWAQWGDANETGKNLILRSIVARMKRDGTLAKTTYWRDVRMLEPIIDKLWEERHG